MAANPLDPVLDFDRVLALASRHVPAAHNVTAVDESGGEARTYVIDGTFIFKTQRPHRVRPRTSLQKESLHLKLLASHMPELPVPRVLGYGRDEGIEYTVMTRIPGTAVLNTAIAGTAGRVESAPLSKCIGRQGPRAAGRD